MSLPQVPPQSESALQEKTRGSWNKLVNSHLFLSPLARAHHLRKWSSNITYFYYFFKKHQINNYFYKKSTRKWSPVPMHRASFSLPKSLYTNKLKLHTIFNNITPFAIRNCVIFWFVFVFKSSEKTRSVWSRERVIFHFYS